MLVTRAVLHSLAPRIDDLVPQAGGLRTQAAFNAVQTKFVDDQQLEAGIEADTVVDGLVGQGRGQIFQQSAAGGVKDAITLNASGLTDVLNQPAFAQTGLADEHQVLTAADEVTADQGFDLRPWD